MEIWKGAGDEVAGLMRGTLLREAEAWLMRRKEDLARLPQLEAKKPLSH
jgi:hypothetical protein